ncbi:MAG: DUF512 domain-containing protein [Clostridia bacterium]|nr:DUF512 domain-containing protein [Clostridia bacterium]
MDTVTVMTVRPGSPAYKKGIAAKDILISINGHEIKDVLDYRFYLTEKKLTLLLHRGEQLLEIKLRKDEYEDIGLEFETFLMDRQHACKNKCVFCFIDQLPHGMRDSLYFKDDDSRMSFLMGSYVTLTNLTEEDVDRIIAMHMSPIHISVHTTDPLLRVEMMKNKHAGEVLSYLRRFADANISMECQIVLCKDINDGDALDRTMNDLCTYLPALSTCSIVPCGLTCHREGLTPIEPFSAQDCKKILKQVGAVQKRCVEEFGRAVFYCSDEIYLKAEEPFPSGEFYGEYAQIENGVGMIPSMRDEFDARMDVLSDEERAFCGEVSCATGMAAYPFLASLCQKLSAEIPRLCVRLFPIRNDFFGHEITVAGLVTGKDLIRQLKGQSLGDALCIPSVMLRHEGDLFLDDVSVSDVEEALGVPIRVVDTNFGADAFVDALLGLS